MLHGKHQEHIKTYDLNEFNSEYECNLLGKIETIINFLGLKEYYAHDLAEKINNR